MYHWGSQKQGCLVSGEAKLSVQNTTFRSAHLHSKLFSTDHNNMFCRLSMQPTSCSEHLQPLLLVASHSLLRSTPLKICLHAVCEIVCIQNIFQYILKLY